MMTVSEVSRLSGVTVRTLHHYDAIGLLCPAEVTEAGYRLYDESNLERLHSILMLRELRFSLKEIAAIIDNPSFEIDVALDDQITLLELEYERIERLIAHAKRMRENGGSIMDFSAYDESKLSEYRAEAKKRWGDSEAYRDFESRGESGADFAAEGEKLMSLLAGFGKLRDSDPGQDDAQRKVHDLQQFITGSFYVCTDEILAGLGQMYVADERFKRNIDKAGGMGTAQFISEAIAQYCSVKS